MVRAARESRKVQRRLPNPEHPVISTGRILLPSGLAVNCMSSPIMNRPFTSLTVVKKPRDHATSDALGGACYGSIDDSGRLMVAEYKLNAVFAVTSEGLFVGALGGGHSGFTEQRGFAAGKGGSEFDRPHMCRGRADGTLIVADTWNHRLQLFSHDGRFLGVLGGGLDGWREDPVTTAEGRDFGRIRSAGGDFNGK